jgi:hypothetical protein
MSDSDEDEDNTLFNYQMNKGKISLYFKTSDHIIFHIIDEFFNNYIVDASLSKILTENNIPNFIRRFITKNYTEIFSGDSLSRKLYTENESYDITSIKYIDEIDEDNKIIQGRYIEIKLFIMNEYTMKIKFDESNKFDCIKSYILMLRNGLS